VASASERSDGPFEVFSVMVNSKIAAALSTITAGSGTWERERTRDFHFPTTREGEVTRLDFCSTQL
jgi:hypothetical protein